MSILEDFENSNELIMGFSEYGVPLVCIYDFDSAIDELKQCYSEIKDKENIIAELLKKLKCASCRYSLKEEQFACVLKAQYGEHGCKIENHK